MNGAPDALSVAALEARIGEELGVLTWRTVTQADLDRFADATDDHQFIHVDPERAAAETPFGGTVAHGFLTLAWLSRFAREVLPPVAGRRMAINYGLDRVRFVVPVRSGDRIRGRFVLRGVERRAERDVMLRYGVMVEIEGGAKPVLAAEWLTLAVLG